MRAFKYLIVVLMMAGAVTAFSQDTPVQTTRDDKGVWFIEGGDTLYDVFEAMGYEVASDRLFQIDLFRRSSRGTMSELFGAEFLGINFINGDIAVRNIMYSEAELTQLYDELDDEAKMVVQGHVDGINRRVFEIYGDFMLMPFEYWMGSFFSFFVEGLGYNMLPTPWTVEDQIAWIAVMQRNFDPEGGLDGQIGQLNNAVLFGTWAQVYPEDFLAMFSDVRWLNDPAAQTMIPATAKSAAVAQPRMLDLDPNAFPDLAAATARIRAQFHDRNEALERMNAKVKMGSYAWAISGDKTASGNPIIYSGPQMGFTTPSIIAEGSIRGAGLDVSGMVVPGIPAIVIGRTPHHAWSMQVGHGHALDWFIEAPQSVFLDRVEVFHPAGGDEVSVPIYRSAHGPIVDPFPYDPDNPPPFAVSYAYAHWGREAKSIEAFLKLARATSIAEFDEGIETIALSHHFTYADRDGNIAYWMSGYDPIRAPGVDPRFPQIADGTQEWTGERRPRAHDSNTAQGFYGGWNNKASTDYNNSPNNASYSFGSAHRAHVVDDYLSTHDELTYEEVRDLAVNVATTDSFGGGGNTWSFVADDFSAAAALNSSVERDAAINMLDAWDGHFVAGGPAEWRFGDLRADAWVLQDAWIREVLRLTFEDEYAASGMDWNDESKGTLFNVLLRVLAGGDAPMPAFYDWFQDRLGSGKPTTAEGIIIEALDNVIATMGLGPFGAPRGSIVFGHPLLGAINPAFDALHSMPFSSRSTYAHCIEFGPDGPIRIESMFPLGESGQLWFNGTFNPVFDPNFFSMAPAFDPFLPRPFPLFE